MNPEGDVVHIHEDDQTGETWTDPIHECETDDEIKERRAEIFRRHRNLFKNGRSHQAHNKHRNCMKRGRR